MEDIKKRADEYSEKEWGEFGLIPKLLAREAYIAGALEQKRITQMIDSAGDEWMDEFSKAMGE